MSFLFETIMRSSMVLICGLLATAALRKQPAALKHWVLTAALALGAAQPAMNLIVPAWRMPALNLSVRRAPAAAVETEVALAMGPPVAAARVPVTATLDALRVGIVVWLIGLILSLFVLVSGAIWLMWLGSRAVNAGANWRSAGEAVRKQLGIGTPVRIAITGHPALLVTWGAVWPIILLPRDAGSWPAERIQLVLAHEMAHLVRRDWLIQLSAEVVRAVNWFNPLFWIACARLRRESEYACDDVVLDLGIGGTSYASHLLDLARSFSLHGRTWLPAPSIARPSTLERRVRAMLNPQLNRRPVSAKHRFVFAALLMAVALPIAAASQAPATPSGTLTDPSGRPLADAIVRLTAISSDVAHETRTDATGAFQFGDVPSGDYLLAARYPGFSTQRQRVRLSGGGATFSLQLNVGTLQETISVTGGGLDKDGPRTEERVRYTPSACTPSSGGQLSPPMKVRDVRPRYKKAWVEANIQGKVLMQARIGADGRVMNVDVISPVNAELEDEAIAAVSQWEFSPTYLNCEAVPVTMYVTVSFTIER